MGYACGALKHPFAGLLDGGTAVPHRDLDAQGRDLREVVAVASVFRCDGRAGDQVAVFFVNLYVIVVNGDDLVFGLGTVVLWVEERAFEMGGQDFGLTGPVQPPGLAQGLQAPADVGQGQCEPRRGDGGDAVLLVEVTGAEDGFDRTVVDVVSAAAVDVRVDETRDGEVPPCINDLVGRFFSIGGSGREDAGDPGVLDQEGTAADPT